MRTTWPKNLDTSAIILTPNSRLSRFLQRAINKESTIKVRQTPKILPLQTWLYDCYRQTLLQHQQPLNLLSANQELQLWQSIIKASKIGKELLQLTTTVQTVQQAYQTLHAWNLDLAILEYENNLNSQVFLNWSRTFDAKCEKQQWLATAKLYNYLADAFTHQDSLLPQTIYLFNFDELTPQAKTFFTHLKTLGIHIEHIEETVINKQFQQVRLNDIEEELFTMARWAKWYHTENPEKMITCIVPNLTDIRSQVKQIFTRVFFPQAIFDANFTQETFNISGGYPLNEAAIIHTALNILNYQPYDINIDQCTFLLTNAFIANFSEESQARAQIDCQLREANQIQPRWQLIQTLLESSCPSLHQNIVAWQKYYKNLPAKQSLACWQESFRQLLQYIGWPGNRTLNSTEYQQITRWYELLYELPQLTLVQQDYTYKEALQLLQQLTQNSLFEIESHDGPIQILGVLEAAGSISDYLWVMHLDDETFPQQAKPNPFLPYHLQRQQQMPHSSAARELNFSNRLSQRFQQSASNIIFSYHQYDGDRQLNASPLLSAVPAIKKSDLLLVNYEELANTLQRSGKCEYIDDQQAPSIQKGEEIAGGTGIFKQQAACPFRAFAEYRLHAAGLTIPNADLNALERGTLLHICLDKVWQILKTHENLQQQTENNLSILLEKVVTESIADFLNRSAEAIKPRFRLLEHQRLKTLLYKWLQYEKQRPAFTVVAHEQWRQIQIGALPISIQIDRIDTLSSGEKLIFDYKTSIVNPTSWFGNRPKEPQLLLYTLSEADIRGISFAQVRIDDMQFKGIAADDVHIKGIKLPEQYQNYNIPTTWSSLVNEWKTIMEQLANNFVMGDAKVDPADDDTCNHCTLSSLCRINEKRDL